MEQLLWLETLVKGGIGLLLLVAPKLLIRVFALPPTQSSFWPRLTGAVLIGLAVTIFLSGAKYIDDGIGLTGLAIINASVASVMLTYYGAARAPSINRRGRAMIAVLAIVLFLFSGLELILR